MTPAGFFIAQVILLLILLGVVGACCGFRRRRHRLLMDFEYSMQKNEKVWQEILANECADEMYGVFIVLDGLHIYEVFSPSNADSECESFATDANSGKNPKKFVHLLKKKEKQEISALIMKSYFLGQVSAYSVKEAFYECAAGKGEDEYDFIANNCAGFLICMGVKFGFNVKSDEALVENIVSHLMENADLAFELMEDTENFLLLDSNPTLSRGVTAAHQRAVLEEVVRLNLVMYG